MNNQRKIEDWTLITDWIEENKIQIKKEFKNLLKKLNSLKIREVKIIFIFYGDSDRPCIEEIFYEESKTTAGSLEEIKEIAKWANRFLYYSTNYNWYNKVGGNGRIRIDVSKKTAYFDICKNISALDKTGEYK